MHLQHMKFAYWFVILQTRKHSYPSVDLESQLYLLILVATVIKVTPAFTITPQTVSLSAMMIVLPLL